MAKRRAGPGRRGFLRRLGVSVAATLAVPGAASPQARKPAARRKAPVQAKPRATPAKAAEARPPAPSEPAPEPAPITRSSSARDRPSTETAPAPAPVRELPTAAPPAREGSPQGSPMASGSSAEISGFDDPDFTYGYYADLLLSRIREHWDRPPLGGEIELVVHFQIDREGGLDDLKILRSSGYNSFDRAGLQAIQRAALPPLPKSYRPSSLGVRIRIH